MYLTDEEERRIRVALRNPTAWHAGGVAFLRSVDEVTTSRHGTDCVRTAVQNTLYTLETDAAKAVFVLVPSSVDGLGRCTAVKCVGRKDAIAGWYVLGYSLPRRDNVIRGAARSLLQPMLFAQAVRDTRVAA